MIWFLYSLILVGLFAVFLQLLYFWYEDIMIWLEYKIICIDFTLDR